MKIKFDPRLKDPMAEQSETPKKIAYFLIKLGVLQPFLKKIELSERLGDVIFVAGQIKGFDLKKKEVWSFPPSKKFVKEFIVSKKTHKKFSEQGFAPKIIELDLKDKIPFTKEELLREYGGKNDIEVFRRLLSFYRKMGVEKISLKRFARNLRIKMEKSDLKNKEIENILDELSKKNQKILIARTHGDFGKGQVLIGKRNYVFTDWYPDENIEKKNIISGDLIKFFGKEINLLEDRKFQEILKLYPKNVRENIEIYILLGDISFVIDRKRIREANEKRIKFFSKNLLKEN